MDDLPKLRLALAQINTTVGDLEGNAARIADFAGRARAEGADLVVFPELCLPGYPAEDLYLRSDFVAANRRALESLAQTIGLDAVIGFAEPAADATSERPVHNSVALLSDGAVRAVYRKQRLPNYAVFDEARYFWPGSEPVVVEAGGWPIGLTICEDCWAPGPPASTEAELGARLILNPSGSPYHRGKGREREAMFAERARAYGVHFAFCNLVGGQDELVFDGHSLVVDPEGNVLARAAQFEEELLLCDLPAGRGASLAEPLDDLDEVYRALVLGLRDYVGKNGFRHVGLGLSGGIDSALVAMIAADALGADRVSTVVMPSPHSSDETQADARATARNLGTELVEIPIGEAMTAYDEALAPSFDGLAPGVAQENLQARIRGNLMMALSNQHGWLVLTTGNKSELSVGYATLYGDMAGGFAVIKDVPKTLVYELVRHRNEREGTELVPASVLERAPSAELRPGQRDTDSLPAYELLDRILEDYVERDRGPEEMIADGLPEDVVREVTAMVDRSEYKRRQAPPGIRITPKAFGRDRRLPITNRFGG
jgi:NAD+ synthase (glutamine-hydrolysing)